MARLRIAALAAEMSCLSAVPLWFAGPASAQQAPRTFGAGYQLTEPISSIAATVNVPRWHCPKTSTFAMDVDVEGAGIIPGVEVGCLHGHATAFAVAQSHHVQVSPGDSVTLHAASSSTTWSGGYYDRTTRRGWSGSEKAPYGNTTGGGWVGTALYGSGVVASGPLRFKNVRVNGQPLRWFSPRPLQQVVLDRVDRPVVNTLPITRAGTAFTITFTPGTAASEGSDSVTPLPTHRTQIGYLINELGMPLTLPAANSSLVEPGSWDCRQAPVVPDCQHRHLSPRSYEVLVNYTTNKTPGRADEAKLIKALENRQWTVTPGRSRTNFEVRGHGFAGTVQVFSLASNRDVKPFPYAAPEMAAYFTLRQIAKQYGAAYG